MTLVVLDVDGVLIDVQQSFTHIVRELSGASDADIAIFKAHGGFNDDWELARAAKAWIAAGRPSVLHNAKTWRDVVEACGNDPGDLTPACIDLYRGGYWTREVPLVSTDLLERVASRFSIAACTGRDEWEMERAEKLLGFSFSRKTTSEHARKPNADALLRLLHRDEDLVVFLGDTEADRQTVLAAREEIDLTILFYEVSRRTPAAKLMEAMWEATDARDVATRLCEPTDR